MRRDVATQINQLKSKLGGYVSVMAYRYANLCIEADPVALLPIFVTVDGDKKPIEDVAQVAIHEKYHFNIFPIYEDDLYMVGQAIAEAHPEFKQEVKTYEGYEEDDPAGKYIFCSMPEVNKDYHDTLLKATDTLYKECKDRMELAHKTCMAKLAICMAGASESEMDQLKDYCDQIVQQFADVRDKTQAEKQQQIEDAYADYQKRQEEKEAQQQEEQQEKGNPMQMKINTDD